MQCQIRGAVPSDLDAVAELEAVCFPAAEAAGRESLRQRIAAFPESFLVAELDGRLVGMVNGCVTDQRTITDDLYEGVSGHNPQGAWQSVFGLDVLPQYRRQGIAGALLRRLIDTAQSAGRRGVILTCKEHLCGYYEGFGFRCLGVSDSVHGGAVWYDMLLEFGPGSLTKV